MPSIILLVDVSAMMALKFQICHANPLTENLKKQFNLESPLVLFLMGHNGANFRCIFYHFASFASSPGASASSVASAES